MGSNMNSNTIVAGLLVLGLCVGAFKVVGSLYAPKTFGQQAQTELNRPTAAPVKVEEPEAIKTAGLLLAYVTACAATDTTLSPSRLHSIEMMIGASIAAYGETPIKDVAAGIVARQNGAMDGWCKMTSNTLYQAYLNK